MQYLIDSLHQYSLYEYLWFFIIYAVGGWCLEVSYHVVTKGHFINRGFLNGPVCPIYGFGMIIVIICLLPLKDNKVIMFFGSIVLATLLELVTGFLLEKLFHERWWDYSKEPFNFHGYICLKFSIEWGIACLIVVDVVHAFFAGIIKHFPKVPGVVLLVICLAVFAADCVATVVTIRGLNKRLKLMNDVGARIRKLSDAMGENITDATLQGIEKSQQVKEQLDDTKEKLDERSEAVKKEMEAKKQLINERSEAALEELDERSEAFKKQLAEGREKLSEVSADIKEQIDAKRIESAQERAARAAERNAQMEKELAALKARLEKLRAPQARGQRRLLRAFPEMKNAKFDEEIKLLKKVAAQSRKGVKAKESDKSGRKNA